MQQKSPVRRQGFNIKKQLSGVIDVCQVISGYINISIDKEIGKCYVVKTYDLGV